jgi:hypothetical protein
MGLPEYRPMPEHKPPDVQPNPRPKRYLPPTREPGIWAADDNDVTEVDPKEFTLLGVVLPLPPEAYKGKPADIQPAIDCTRHWNKVLATDAAKWVHDVKDDAVRRCLAAMMNEACMSLPEAAHEQMKSAGVISIALEKDLPARRRRAEAFVDLMCRDARTIGFYIDRLIKLVPSYQEVAIRDIVEGQR